jgi:hypothetical protein
LKEVQSTPTGYNNSMADPATTTTELLSGASPEMRRSIVSGMRWTLWLSMLSVPLGYATTLIRARIGPAASVQPSPTSSYTLSAAQFYSFHLVRILGWPLAGLAAIGFFGSVPSLVDSTGRKGFWAAMSAEPFRRLRQNLKAKN